MGLTFVEATCLVAVLLLARIAWRLGRIEELTAAQADMLGVLRTELQSVTSEASHLSLERSRKLREELEERLRARERSSIHL